MRPAFAEPPVLARGDVVTIGLSWLRCENQSVESVADDEGATEAEEHPQEIPRHALQHLAAVDVAADSEQLHVRSLVRRLCVSDRARDEVLQQRNLEVVEV